MKTAIYIEDGSTQLVLTPENDWETKVIAGIQQGLQEVEILRGSFYECRGGYFRHGGTDDSLMLRAKVKANP